MGGGEGRGLVRGAWPNACTHARTDARTYVHLTQVRKAFSTYSLASLRRRERVVLEDFSATAALAEAAAAAAVVRLCGKAVVMLLHTLHILPETV